MLSLSRLRSNGFLGTWSTLSHHVTSKPNLLLRNQFHHNSRLLEEGNIARTVFKQPANGKIPPKVRTEYRSPNNASPPSSGAVSKGAADDVPIPPNKIQYKGKVTQPIAMQILRARLAHLQSDPKFIKHCEDLGISAEVFKQNSIFFAQAVLRGQIPRCTAQDLLPIISEEGQESVDRYLSSAFFTYIEENISEEDLETLNSLREITDLRYPGEWYPAARSMQRKIILHVGPTNSGKTYNALKCLEESESGVYCGPLRLLALEIFERMNKKGKLCNLVTGEEQRIVGDEAPLVSSTVEMVNLKKRVKVAVVDEIQMIADKDRGWAWTQAVLGLQAEEIHLCGEPSIVPLVSEICRNMNEEVEVRKYDRLSSLKILSHSLNSSFRNIRKGDCVVTFSRKNIFAVKKAIEQETKLKCAVIYGSLPPETRSEQAKLFNDANSEYDVLVASDAIGMGLNLNIRRVVFETLLKFNGIAMRPVSLSQIKQIAGRAGRFGTAYDVGEVTTLDHFDLKILHRAMKTSIPTVQHAGLQANVNVVEMFAYQFPNDSFSALLSKFEDLAKVDGRYFLCNFHNQKRIADLIDELSMSIQERYQFVTAPANIKDPVVSKSLLQFASDFSEGAISPLDLHIKLPSKAPKSMAELKNLESYHRVILLYMWLGYRFPDIFNSGDSARELKLTCEGLINESLRNMHFARKAPVRKMETDIVGFNSEAFPTKDLVFDRSKDPNLIPVNPVDQVK